MTRLGDMEGVGDGSCWVTPRFWGWTGREGLGLRRWGTRVCGGLHLERLHPGLYGEHQIH
jgi:hypothetical protein